MNSTTPPETYQTTNNTSDSREEGKMQSGEMNAAVALTRLTSSSPDSSSGGEEFAGTAHHENAKPATEIALQPPIIDTPKTFPQMLMEILNDKDNEDTVCWLPHGCSFRINKREKFLNEVLPHYYKKTVKYTSFTRKLSRWDFIRLSSGPDTGAFYHKLFQRDNPRLSKKMFCKGERPQFIRTMPMPSAAVLPMNAYAMQSLALQQQQSGLFPSAAAALLGGQGLTAAGCGGTAQPSSSYLTGAASLRANMLATLQSPSSAALSAAYDLPLGCGLAAAAPAPGGLTSASAVSAFGASSSSAALDRAYSELESRRMIDAAVRVLYRSEAQAQAQQQAQQQAVLQQQAQQQQAQQQQQQPGLLGSVVHRAMLAQKTEGSPGQYLPSLPLDSDKSKTPTGVNRAYAA